MGTIFKLYANTLYNPTPEDVPKLAVEDLDAFELQEVRQHMPSPTEDDPE